MGETEALRGRGTTRSDQVRWLPSSEKLGPPPLNSHLDVAAFLPLVWEHLPSVTLIMILTWGASWACRETTR